jgi:hypothetical protein
MSLKCWCHQCRYHVWNTHIININVISEKHWCHKCISHVWKRQPIKLVNIYNNSVFLDVASTFMTFMFFRHDISIDDISVFHMISNENHFIYRWMTKTKNSFDNKSVTFLQLNDDNTTISPFVLVNIHL